MSAADVRLVCAVSAVVSGLGGFDEHLRRRRAAGALVVTVGTSAACRGNGTV